MLFITSTCVICFKIHFLLQFNWILTEHLFTKFWVYRVTLCWYRYGKDQFMIQLLVEVGNQIVYSPEFYVWQVFWTWQPCEFPLLFHIASVVPPYWLFMFNQIQPLKSLFWTLAEIAAFQNSFTEFICFLSLLFPVKYCSTELLCFFHRAWQGIQPLRWQALSRHFTMRLSPFCWVQSLWSVPNYVFHCLKCPKTPF